MNGLYIYCKLFRILQKYKFESKSQRYREMQILDTCCLGYYKNTNLKANHNSIVNNVVNGCAV